MAINADKTRKFCFFNYCCDLEYIWQ